MPDTPQGNAVIGQSGGPTAVINQSLVGVLRGLKEHGGGRIGKILGAHHAVHGIIRDRFIELGGLGEDTLEKLAATPSAGLGSSRDKPDEEYCRKIFEAFEKHDVRYFFYIGGNDSSDACRIVAETAKARGYPLHAYHVPKTIDNDLVKNDHTPGFGSAAKFVAQAFMGDNLDNKSLPGIKINVVMGRHAGFLTAASMLGRREGTDDGPHLVYVPEVDFDIDRFKADVEKVYARHGRCLVAISEGIHDKEGNAIAAELARQHGQVERDAHGNIQLSGTGALGDHLAKALKEHFKGKGEEEARVRADTFGYLQRCFVGCVSQTDAAEARAAGEAAAKHALAGEHPTGSIAIQRASQDPYQAAYKRIELTDVAAKTRTLDRGYIVDGRDIAESFKAYLAPIVGPLPEIETIT